MSTKQKIRPSKEIQLLAVLLVSLFCSSHNVLALLETNIGSGGSKLHLDLENVMVENGSRGHRIQQHRNRVLVKGSDKDGKNKDSERQIVAPRLLKGQVSSESIKKLHSLEGLDESEYYDDGNRSLAWEHKGHSADINQKIERALDTYESDSDSIIQFRHNGENRRVKPGHHNHHSSRSHNNNNRKRRHDKQKRNQRDGTDKKRANNETKRTNPNRQKRVKNKRVEKTQWRKQQNRKYYKQMNKVNPHGRAKNKNKNQAHKNMSRRNGPI